ncbi:hypothetical protein EW145_g3491 [Phellinidium pouzarii]|uniref:Telomere-associated protein Rif1 N-terminal domain-containing protein n=1 Tax=Phellinidium pouzarii TaxID=167371 RepID=A0A4S4L765_9AGAM|nr:hypothetical protein EW145_g3491 [Phellinidium pouzarii]
MLPTPPRPSHCQLSDTENLPLTPRKCIEWATSKEIFILSETARTLNMSGSTREPRKSILKPSRPLQPFAQEKKRDFTPLPDNALSNPHFLKYPVATIVSKESTLRELTEAYSILTARIRASVSEGFWLLTAHDQQYPLFQPLRLHADALANAIVRDLGRVFADPFLYSTPLSGSEAGPSRIEKSSLPTPRETPSPKSPKKGGMTEEQVKYARDLSTVASATVRFLILAFQAPSIYNVFTTKQLNSILTGALAIPLADSLRSSSARKICGFAITLLQSQKLPEDILAAARDRIMFALRRAMDGELGREGKKGAAGEALRAVHDLSLYKPAIFVPGFELYLASILDNLIAPSCVLRVQAAHALGGFVLGIMQPGLDFDDLLRTISPRVVEFFLRKEAGPNSQSIIVRTLRASLRASEPTHHAQGPFWAISVLASLVVLFGPALLKDSQLLEVFRATIDISLRTKKKVVRMMSSTLWGPLIWVWQKWRGSVDILGKDEDTEQEVAEREKVKTCFSHMLRLTTHLPIGLSFISALLGDSHASCQRQDLLMALFELGVIARRGSDMTSRAIVLLDRLINAREDSEFFENWSSVFLGKLIPISLLSVSPGLLTTDMNSPGLISAVDTIVSQQPNIEDVRPLSDEERRLPIVWTRAKDIWIGCLEQLQLQEDEPAPEIIVEIWTGLVRMGLSSKLEPATIGVFADQCAIVLTSILTNESIDLRERADDSKALESESSINGVQKVGGAKRGTCTAANLRSKLALVRVLWAATISVLPAQSWKWAVKPMLRFLVQKYPYLVSSSDEDEDEDEALSEWAQLCAQVTALSPTDITVGLWTRNWGWDERERARAWRGYARGWAEDWQGSWKGAATILGLPFRQDSPWDMSDPDLSSWSSLLSYAIDAGAKVYVSAPEVLECVVQCIERQHLISLSSTLRVADHLLSAFEKDIRDCRSLPAGLVDLVHEILVTAYPPQPRNKIVAVWLLRSLQMTISNCPPVLVIELLEVLQDGLSIWIADECALFSEEDYSSEIIPLFQTVLVALESLPPSSETLQSLSTIFASALQSDSRTGTIASEQVEALTSFTDFWNNSCKDLEAPKDGWADGIIHALELAFPKDLAEADEEEQVIDADACQKITQDSDDDELDILPRTNTPRRRLLNEIPLPPSPSSIRLQLSTGTSSTITPRKTTKAAVMRPRRLDAPRLPSLFMGSSPSPTVQRTIRRRTAAGRGPRTASGSSTSSLSSEHSNPEKENMLPLSDANGHEEFFLGMKRILVDADSSPLRSKRQRTRSVGSDDSEDARAVEEALKYPPSSSPFRAPFSESDVNSSGLLQTPSKRGRATTSLAVRLPGSPGSPSKRRRMYSNDDSREVKQRLSTADEDDEWLPSSDVESEDETSGSSSPIGPFTPQTRRTEFALDIRSEPTYDDSGAASSSPTRNIRRLARPKHYPPALTLHENAAPEMH